jgi:hypothetical protein
VLVEAPSASDNGGGVAAPGVEITTTDGVWDSVPPITTVDYQWYASEAPAGSNQNSISGENPGDFYCVVTVNNGVSAPVSEPSNHVNLS